MGFVNPMFLAFLVLIPALVALYFIKSQPVRQTVSSNRLWAAVSQRLRENSLFQRYRNSILLMLQILAVILATLGMAQPFGRVAYSGRSVLVIDLSASMASTDLEPTRFAAARAAAKALIREHRGEEDIALVSMDATCRLEVPFGSVPGLVSSRLEALRPTDLPGPPVRDLAMMLTGLATQKVERVFLFTDQVPPDGLQEKLGGGLYVKVHYFGTEDRNVAVSRFAFDEDPAGGGILSATITSYGKDSAPVEVSVLHEGKSLHRETVQVLGKENAAWKHALTTAPKGLYEMKVTSAADRLAADSSARLLIGATSTRIAVISRNPAAILRLLDKVEGIEATGHTPQDLAGNEPIADLYILDGVSHPDLCRRQALIFLAEGDPHLTSGPSRPAGAISRALWTHPLMKYVSLEGLTFEGLRPLKPGSGDVEVVGAAGGPLITVRTDGDTRQVLCSFGLDGTNLGARVTFPILVLNAVKWLGRRDLAGGRSHRVGHPYPLPAHWTGELELTAPDQTVTKITPQRRDLPGSSLSAVGSHRLRWKEEERVIPVNLEDFGESRIEPASRTAVELGKAGAAGAPVPRTYWKPFILLALLLLFLEWGLYCKLGG